MPLEKPTPQAGEHWRLQPTPDPFDPPKAFPPVRILEVRDGWTRYWMSTFSPDERKKTSEFVGMYNRVGLESG